MLDFLYGIMKILDIDDEPTFVPVPIVNVTEETTTLLQAAQFLPAEYVTQEILYLRGDGDRTAEILDQMAKENLARMAGLGLPKSGEAAGGEQSEGEDEEL